MELLACLLKEGLHVKKVYNSLKILNLEDTHIAFADDVLVFFKGEKTSL